VARKDDGAAAVEFALVLPILIALVLGIVEFGYFLFLNGTAANAARDGAREMAIHNVLADATEAASGTFLRITGHTPVVVVTPEVCVTGDPVAVSVTYDYGALTGFFGNGFTAHGTGEMRCGG